MKTLAGSAFTSLFMGGASVALAAIHPILSNVAAILGIVVSLATIWMLVSSAKKMNLESRKTDLEMDLIFERCKNCTDPKNCVFNPDHRPDECKWRDK